MAAIYKDLRALLMRFASRYFQRPQEVEDVVQEAFVKVIEAQHRRGIREPRSYLFKTARNLAISELRSSHHRLTDTVGELLPELELLQTPTMEQQFESRSALMCFVALFGDCQLRVSGFIFCAVSMAIPKKRPLNI